MAEVHHQIEADWIAIDWGTSSLRVWAMSSQGRILDQLTSDLGMAAVQAAQRPFEDTLTTLIEPWLSHNRTLDVIACGMIGARGGWQEIPYGTTPCAPSTPLHQATVTDPRYQLWIHAGLSQSDPADVMRGEETQLAGLLQESPEFDGLVCLPGTHSKWARLAEGRLLEFRTFLTGEVFALLTKHSILRLTVATEGWNDDAFLEGVSNGADATTHFLAEGFTLRAKSLLQDFDGIAARSRLSGLLIGAELASALSDSELGKTIALIGKNELSSRYALALEALDRESLCFDAESLTLAGLRLGWERLPRE